MKTSPNPNSPWFNCSVYRFGKIEIAIIKARKTDPVRWYSELHVAGRYRASYGSNAPFKLWAVIVAAVKGTYYE